MVPTKTVRGPWMPAPRLFSDPAVRVFRAKEFILLPESSAPRCLFCCLNRLKSTNACGCCMWGGATRGPKSRTELSCLRGAFFPRLLIRLKPFLGPHNSTYPPGTDILQAAANGDLAILPSRPSEASARQCPAGDQLAVGIVGPGVISLRRSGDKDAPDRSVLFRLTSAAPPPELAIRLSPSPHPIELPAAWDHRTTTNTSCASPACRVASIPSEDPSFVPKRGGDPVPVPAAASRSPQKPAQAPLPPHTSLPHQRRHPPWPPHISPPCLLLRRSSPSSTDPAPPDDAPSCACRQTSRVSPCCGNRSSSASTVVDDPIPTLSTACTSIGFDRLNCRRRIHVWRPSTGPSPRHGQPQLQQPLAQEGISRPIPPRCRPVDSQGVQNHNRGPACSQGGPLDQVSPRR